MKRVLTKDIKACAIRMRATQDLDIKRPDTGYQYEVYLNGGLFSEMRPARMMAFCEGWLIRDEAVNQPPQETPVYIGMTVITGVCYVLSQISNQQKLWCGSPERGDMRGWPALLINHPEHEILPLFHINPSIDEEASSKFYRAVIEQVTEVLCNIWEVQNKAKTVSEK